MSIAKVSEISATSTESFEDAIRKGIERANKTLRNVKSAWIKEQHVRVEKGGISEYQVKIQGIFPGSGDLNPLHIFSQRLYGLDDTGRQPLLALSNE